MREDLIYEISDYLKLTFPKAREVFERILKKICELESSSEEEAVQSMFLLYEDNFDNFKKLVNEYGAK